tara:strand:+ start:3757 stop:4563 length:807 start_codon:yes stop_codon:yes gene_type:complete
MENKVCIIIPLYKKDFTEIETISLNQFEKVLKKDKYNAIIVCPKSLDLPLRIIDGKYNIQRFENHFFENIMGYNKLLLSKKFYLRFRKYEYMLIHQLDAYVFKDELMHWCSKGYDYIGAPWFKNYVDGDHIRDIYKVGNGGFSLRKTKTFIDTFKQRNNYIRDLRDIIWEIRNKKFSLLKYFHGFNYQNKILRTINKYIELKKNEDAFWSIEGPKLNQKFNVAKMKDAIKFSFENSPELLFSENNNNLPFGCHKWEQYMHFWKNHIKK